MRSLPSCLLLVLVLVAQVQSKYIVGAGMGDVTGPAAQVGMMGYAMMNQVTKGMHFRLWARAFIFANASSPYKRVVYVSVDTCMVYGAVKYEVVSRLATEFGKLYNADNVVLSGIHTHSGPGGYSWNTVYDITTLGFHRANWEDIVSGIVASVQAAHENFQSRMFMGQTTRLTWAEGELLKANINRSPTAYLNNPLAERKKYKYNVDKNMTVLRLDSDNGENQGLIAWFAVHCTSMNNTNKLISGDNKGYASMRMERSFRMNDSLPGPGQPGDFVAAFGQSNEGDVSPNTRGAFCLNGEPCETAHSTCGGRSEGCHGIGPGRDMFESTQIIGEKQYAKARELWGKAKAMDGDKGDVVAVHRFVDMSNVSVRAEFTATGQPETTCKPALGDAFAAGTTDGPGDFDFVQGTNASGSPNKYWNLVGQLLTAPSKEQRKCQYPKPVLLNVAATFPTPWVPRIMPIQLVRIGSLFLIAVPGEFTTMSGRRLRDTVRSQIVSTGLCETPIVVIAGLSNEYSNYIATYEEYIVQRYEGASTLWGPHTLAAYQQLYAELVDEMAGVAVAPANQPSPRSYIDEIPSFVIPAGVDVPVDGHTFGHVLQDVPAGHVVQRSQNETVVVEFVGGNPRHDALHGSSFLFVQRQVNGKDWLDVENDASWSTQMHWRPGSTPFSSIISIHWTVDESVVPGTYRIVHNGYVLLLLKSRPDKYSGTSAPFSVA